MPQQSHECLLNPNNKTLPSQEIALEGERLLPRAFAKACTALRQLANSLNPRCGASVLSLKYAAQSGLSF
jgi:hypothetical protein